MCLTGSTWLCHILVTGWLFPVNTPHWLNVGPMLGRRRRRWPNISPTLGRCVVFSGNFTVTESGCETSLYGKIGYIVRCKIRQIKCLTFFCNVLADSLFTQNHMIMIKPTQLQTSVIINVYYYWCRKCITSVGVVPTRRLGLNQSMPWENVLVARNSVIFSAPVRLDWSLCTKHVLMCTRIMCFGITWPFSTKPKCTNCYL